MDLRSQSFLETIAQRKVNVVVLLEMGRKLKVDEEGRVYVLAG